MTTFGMPLFLEDRTGRLTGSEFVDLYDRARFSLRCTQSDAEHSVYMIYDVLSNEKFGRGGLAAPAACLEFGPDNALGKVKIGRGDYVPIDQYLSKVSIFSGSTRTRKFVASNGQEYRWQYRPAGTADEDIEWSCTSSDGYHLASYSLKPPSEPLYRGSSGCVLTVEEAFPHLVGELLASLTIMRHIAKHNL